MSSQTQFSRFFCRHTSCFTKILSAFLSAGEEACDLMCCWKQAFLWSLLHQRYESRDLWNEKLSMTETSDRVRTRRSVMLQTHHLRWAEFKMIRPHLSETDRADEGRRGAVSPGHPGAACAHTGSRLCVLKSSRYKHPNHLCVLID